MVYGKCYNDCMNIGAHVSIAGGVQEAPLNAAKSGCECFQMFSRSPRGGPAPDLNKEVVTAFNDNCKQKKITNYYIHTPYYINLASAKDKISKASVRVIRDELERASVLGARAVMTHLGSAKDLGPKKALQQTIAGVRDILNGYTGSAQFLIENSAGSGGTIIGDTFEQIGAIISAHKEHDIGVCFDTCHAFVSGYDLRTSAAVETTFKEFDKHIGLKKLKLIHANDTQKELGSHVDRHEHIGLGQIGEKGFRALMQHPALRLVDWILETPHDGKEIKDLTNLKKFRDA